MLTEYRSFDELHGEAAFNLSPVFSLLEINRRLGALGDREFKAIWYFAAGGFQAATIDSLTYRCQLTVSVFGQRIVVKRVGVPGRVAFDLNDVHDAWLFATESAGYLQ